MKNSSEIIHEARTLPGRKVNTVFSCYKGDLIFGNVTNFNDTRARADVTWIFLDRALRLRSEI